MPVVTISGTSGANAITISTAGIYSVNLGSGDDTLTAHVATTITAHGGVGNDSLLVTESTGLIYGDSGQDTIQASSGIWTIFGGTGTVDPGDGKDSFSVETATAIVYGNGGNDTIDIGYGGYTVYGGNGNDSAEATADGAIIYRPDSSDTT